ncbi:MAG: sodium ion-translocating decarboxylase subunit beta [Desulfatiglans sp.]|jgi:oxaloacetate decarboxylase beta subunit|nr:sodium ion-translocating decarboxylase subunit beta [Desulfatiglans sp.]
MDQNILYGLWESLGVVGIFGQLGKPLVMYAVGLLLVYLGIKKRWEPLLLIPIGVGIVLTNTPFIGLMNHAPDNVPLTAEVLSKQTGLLYVIYLFGIKTGLFPLLIFMGVGAMTDFGPLIANPKTLFLGAAAQFGIFGTFLGAILLGFPLKEAGSIGIIGGADGPTAIFLTAKLAPHLLGPIAIAAYSYMALVPIIQPPLMKLIVPKRERRIKMKRLRQVSNKERILFPILVTLTTILLIPSAVPLIGMLMFGNLLKECGVVERLANTAKNELINIVTIFLGLTIGATMTFEAFLNTKTISIIVLGLVAFAVGTCAGLLFGRVMCWLSGGKINPLIGSAGVSAVPMAARVSQQVGLEEDPFNNLLMHAMGPNVAGVIGSAVAAGVLLATLGG